MYTADWLSARRNATHQNVIPLNYDHMNPSIACFALLLLPLLPHPVTPATPCFNLLHPATSRSQYVRLIVSSKTVVVFLRVLVLGVRLERRPLCRALKVLTADLADDGFGRGILFVVSSMSRYFYRRGRLTLFSCDLPPALAASFALRSRF